MEQRVNQQMGGYARELKVNQQMGGSAREQRVNHEWVDTPGSYGG